MRHEVLPVTLTFHRRYAEQRDVLTAWRTASHIERPERRKKKDAAPPPPAP